LDENASREQLYEKVFVNAVVRLDNCHRTPARRSFQLVKFQLLGVFSYMSALSFGELVSVDPDTPCSTNQNIHECDHCQDKAAFQIPANEMHLTLRLAQKASSWATSKQRRCFDFVIATFALLISLPVLALVGLAVCLSSPGPILFRQRRMGRSGREFTLYKFRSMRFEEGLGSKITVSGDSRITRVGSFLRRYKLDEIPQFWNVLNGDMSLVGPRPKLPHHEALRLTVRPGITGAATLAFRHEEELLLGIPEHALEAFYEVFIKPTKARLDFEYIRSATCQSDIRLLLSTIISCLSLSKRISAEEWQSILTATE
jgi:lipopolysaccharide/colanic/teichoic acid biosynthesis glycosyltransferase